MSSGARSSSAPPPGTRLGSYVLLEVLGAGAMGVVYRARDEARGGEVAVKVILGRHAADERFARRLRREAAAARGISHPNVVPLLDLGEQQGRLFLVFELVAGGNLHDRLRREGRLPPREAARLGAQIARALAALHRAGLIHRDVKPGNVLLDPPDENGRVRARLADLGLVKRHAVADGAPAEVSMDALTRTGELVGTLLYMAPESATGSGEVDRRSDLYSLGVTLFELVAGEPPFTGSDYELLVRHVRVAPPALSRRVPDVPADLEAVVARLLDKRPEARGTAERAARELEAIADGRRARGDRGRRAALLGVALAAVVAVVGALAAWAHGAASGRRRTAAIRAPAPERARPEPKATAAADATPWPPPLAARAPWPPPPGGWERRWSLGEGPPPVVNRALWADGDGRVADPWRAICGDDRVALAEAFGGVAEPVDEGRVRVRYRTRGGQRLQVDSPGHLFSRGDPQARGTSEATGPTGEPAMRVLAPDNMKSVSWWPGAARWIDPSVRLRLRAEKLDVTSFAVQLVGGAEPDGVGFIWSERGALGQLFVGERVAEAALPLDDGWHEVAFAPGRPAGRRMVIDGRAVGALDAIAAPPPAAAEVTLRFLEGAFTVCGLEVEGRAQRPDRPALARAVADLPRAARVAASFVRRGPGAGGPFVGLGDPEGSAVRLEVDRGAIVVRHEERLLERVAIDPAEPAEGWLLLERIGGELRALIEVDGRRHQVRIGFPLPVAAVRFGAFYGSTAPQVAFTRVEVHAGEEDRLARAVDRSFALGGDTGEAGRAFGQTPDDPETRWRSGALQALGVTDPRYALPEAVGPDAPRTAARRSDAVVAVSRFLSAIERLPAGPVRDDAIARAAYAAGVSADVALARRVGALLREAPGAIAVFDRLEWSRDRHRPILIERFTAGYGMETFAWDAMPAVLEIAEAAHAGVAPPQLSFMRGLMIGNTSRDPAELARAIELIERARGTDAGNADLEIGRILVRLGRPAEARERMIAAIASDRAGSEWYLWMQLVGIELALGRPDRALEAALCSLAHSPTRPASQRAVIEIMQDPALRRQPGLIATAAWLVADARRDASDAEALARSADRVARALPVPAAARERDADLARYARLRAGAPADVPRASIDERPIVAVLRARDGATGRAEAAALLRHAERLDPLVGAIARLDPALVPLLER